MRKLLACRCVSIALHQCGRHTCAAEVFSELARKRGPAYLIGDRVAMHFLQSAHLNPIVYPEVCTWYGALKYAEATKNAALQAELQARYRPLLTPQFHDLIPDREHVDYEIFGIVPLQISIETKDHAALEMGLHFADRQWANPRPDGLSGQTRFWIDDMFMLTILQLEAYRATNDRKYLDRDASEMVAYLRKLQQPNGLFYHAEDVPFFWGRGDGWVAVGMAEMLSSLPEDHPQRAEILAGYRKMMAELLKNQNPDGTWRAVDRSSRGVGGEFLDGHVHVRHDRGSAPRMAARGDIRTGGAQGMDRAGRLCGSERRT